MGDIKDHRDLDAWKVAMDVVCETYLVSQEFPRIETYGLAAQIRRAAVSIPSNIAEGQARSGRAALNHVSIALGSFAELDTQLEVAVRLAYVSLARAAELQRLVGSGRRLLYGLRRAKRLRLGISVAGPICLLALALRMLGVTAAARSGPWNLQPPASCLQPRDILNPRPPNDVPRQAQSRTT